MTAGNTSAAYSVEAKERLRLGGAAGPAVQMQFKSPKGKNLRDEQPANKHVGLSMNSNLVAQQLKLAWINKE